MWGGAGEAPICSVSGQKHTDRRHETTEAASGGGSHKPRNPTAPRSWKRQGGLSPRASGGSPPCRHLETKFRLLASRPVRIHSCGCKPLGLR